MRRSRQQKVAASSIPVSFRGRRGGRGTPLQPAVKSDSSPPAVFHHDDESASQQRAGAPPLLSKSEKILCILFLFSLIFVTPSVRGDGVGYYAFARALLIQHDLHIEKDWRAGYPNLNWGNPDGKGNVSPLQYTATGHLDNYFAIGPAIL